MHRSTHGRCSNKSMGFFEVSRVPYEMTRRGKMCFWDVVFWVRGFAREFCQRLACAHERPTPISRSSRTQCFEVLRQGGGIVEYDSVQ